jgi:hypothetical protein
MKTLPKVSNEAQVDHQIKYGGLEQLERVLPLGIRVAEIKARIEYLRPFMKAVK